MSGSMRLEPGSVVLSPAEVDALRRRIVEWEEASAHLEGTGPAVDLAHEIREILAGAAADVREPAVR